MNRKIFMLAPMLLATALAACSAVPPLEPIERKPAAKPKEMERVSTMPLGQLIAKYAPPSFEYDPQAPGVDYSRPVRFDSALPWPVAFEKALLDAGVDRQALNQSPAPEAAPLVTTAAVTVPEHTDRATASSHLIETTPIAPNSASANRDYAIATPTVSSLAPAAPAAPQCAADDGAAGNSEPVQVWEAQSNASMKQTLEAWSRSAGWEVSWNYIDEQTNNATDLTLGAGKKCLGTFRNAVGSLIDSLPEGDHVHARMWRGNSPPLLRVYNKGKENQ